MRTTSDRRWTLSAAAATAVAVVLVVVWWLSQPSSARDAAGGGGGAPAGGGSTGDHGLVERGSVGPDGPASSGSVHGQPPIGRDPILVDGGVRVDSYVVRGNRLLVNYTSGVPECYGEVALGDVEENGHAVTVRLRSVPPTDPAEQCRDLAVTGTLIVTLRTPLEHRRVVDGSYEPLVLVAQVQRPYVTPDTNAVS
jgi:hypothetical protein